MIRILLLSIVLSACASIERKGSVVYMYKCNKPHAVMMTNDDGSEILHAYYSDLLDDNRSAEQFGELQKYILDNNGYVATVNLDAVLDQSFCGDLEV